MEAQNSLTKMCAVLCQRWQGAVLEHCSEAGGYTPHCVTTRALSAWETPHRDV